MAAELHGCSNHRMNVRVLENQPCDMLEHVLQPIAEYPSHRTTSRGRKETRLPQLMSPGPRGPRAEQEQEPEYRRNVSRAPCHGRAPIEDVAPWRMKEAKSAKAGEYHESGAAASRYEQRLRRGRDAARPRTPRNPSTGLVARFADESKESMRPNHPGRQTRFADESEPEGQVGGQELERGIGESETEKRHRPKVRTLEELGVQCKVKVESGVPSLIEKWRIQRGLFGDFEERFICIRVLTKRRAWLLDIQTELLEKPTHNAIASGGAPGSASRASAAPQAEVKTRGSASWASVVSQEKIIPTRKKIQPTDVTEVSMVV